MNVLRDTLREALALVSRAAGSGSTLPVLTCVDLQAETDGLTLTANNLEMVIRTRIGAQLMGPAWSESLLLRAGAVIEAACWDPSFVPSSGSAS